MENIDEQIEEMEVQILTFSILEGTAFENEKSLKLFRDVVESLKRYRNMLNKKTGEI